MLHCPECQTPFHRGEPFCESCGHLLDQFSGKPPEDSGGQEDWTDDDFAAFGVADPASGAKDSQMRPDFSSMYGNADMSPQGARTGAPSPPQPQSAAADAAYCKGCGAAMRETAKFCSECGRPAPQPPAEAICPSVPCGRTNPPEHKFCQYCGVKIETSSTGPAAPVHQVEPALPVVQTPPWEEPPTEEALPWRQSPSEGYYLIVFDDGNAEALRVSLEEGQSTIGAASPAEGIRPSIDLGPWDHTLKVSRQHAIIERIGDRLFVQDCGSTNGTEVDGRRIQAGQRCEINPPSRLVFGRTLHCRIEANSSLGVR